MEANLTRGRGPTQGEFHAAISTYSGRWYSACLRITRNRDLAEDAVQDALLAAWHKREQFNAEARLDTWIHRIAVNSALALLRRQRPGLFGALDEDYEDDTPSPQQHAENRDIEDNLGRACRQLSEIERVCFMLKHIEEWRLKEIAEVLDTNINTVKQALFRALKKLRVAMSDLKGNHHE
jgi:RNA polymerase sigma-70 factor (ECF subfamily)